MLNSEQLAELRTRPAAPNRVRAAMEIADVRQVQVATGVGVTQAYVSDVVNGRYSRLPLQLAQRMAAYFGCTVDDLFPAQEGVA